ncbi:hypothetical protein AB0B52_32910 [Streptomyces griseofuscus]|uniref:hypothetical protein n=1 Tax=Streptomyces griseofuscus TaxID=146922 RepID=UPI0033DE9A98
MPETTAPATGVASQYLTRVSGDLDETNLKEQERVRQCGDRRRAGAARHPPKQRTGTAVTTTASRPTLVELVRCHLAERKERRSAAEISGVLGRS